MGVLGIVPYQIHLEHAVQAQVPLLYMIFPWAIGQG